MTPLEEIRERGRRNIEGAKRLNAIVCVVIGALFALFALGCFVGVAVAAIASDASTAIGVGVFGLFWSALTALLLGLGLRGLGRIKRDERLRTTGVRAKATILSYVESKLMVDGMNKFQLSLRIEVEGRAPWEVSINEAVMRGAKIYTGATLPILVNAADPRDFMIDWYTGA